MSGNLENLIFSCIDRYFRTALGGTTYHERHAIVTSYDPERYLAKVMYMPEGQESGWLPIETGHIGADYGFATGLQPGDGKTTGDQVIVRFQEGDLESGKIVQRVHSDADKPPTVQSGETVMWAKFKKSTGKSTIGDDTTDTGSGSDADQAQSAQGGSGQQLYLKNDGTVTITDGNGTTIVWDGAGNLNVTTTGNTNITANGNVNITANGSVNVTAPTINCVGNVHLGSSEGVYAAQLGTVDTGGYSDVTALATQVWTT